MEDKVIKSYGIIVYHKSEFTGIYFLLYQHRDSYEYLDIIRGSYQDDNRFKELVSFLCQDERWRLTTHNFKQLWDDIRAYNPKTYDSSYITAKKKFEKYKHNLEDQPSSVKRMKEPPWGFPKGRKQSKETEIECCIREFIEETGITRATFDSHIKISKEDPFTETYKGSDGKTYQTEYYLAESDSLFEIKKVKTPGCIREETVSDEASEVVWFSYEDALKKLEPRRQYILEVTLSSITSLPVM